MRRVFYSIHISVIYDLFLVAQCAVSARRIYRKTMKMESFFKQEKKNFQNFQPQGEVGGVSRKPPRNLRFIR